MIKNNINNVNINLLNLFNYEFLIIRNKAIFIKWIIMINLIFGLEAIMTAVKLPQIKCEKIS